MRIPTVHMNGTSSKQLMEQLLRAHQAIEDALDALAAASPNGRDYYPQGDDALREAQQEHRSRAERLRSVQEELMEIALAVQDQADERETRRNPGHPRAMRLLDALQRAAPELDAHARDVEDFADEDSVMRYTRRFTRAITDALGRHVGLSADWVNEAWPLDNDLFLFAEDDPGAYSVVRQQEEDGEGYTVDEVLIGGRPAYASDHRELIRILKKVA